MTESRELITQHGHDYTSKSTRFRLQVQVPNTSIMYYKVLSSHLKCSSLSSFKVFLWLTWILQRHLLIHQQGYRLCGCIWYRGGCLELHHAGPENEGEPKTLLHHVSGYDSWSSTRSTGTDKYSTACIVSQQLLTVANNIIALLG